MPEFWIGFWFWIFHGSKYASNSQYVRVWNMSGLQRVVNMPDYSWICMKSVFLQVPIVIPCLLERVITWFNKIYSLQYLRLFSWIHKIYFLYSGMDYLICLFILQKIFLQLRFEICCYLLGLRGLGAMNLDMPV